MAGLWLAIALGGVGWFAFPRDRGRRGHARWIGRATLAFALPCLAGLAAMGRIEALAVMPPVFAGMAARLPRYDPISLLPALAVGVPLGMALVAARVAWLRRRGRPLPASLVAPAPLAARSRREMLPATATALAAGVTEELAFRLFIPLTATIASGSALFGFALATIVFVMLHRYQPWWSQIGVALTAAGLIALYLSTGALWLAMAVHAAIDVMALTVRPWLARFGVPPRTGPS